MSAANLDIKSKAPNGVSFNVKGKSAHEGSTSGSVSPQNCSSDVEMYADAVFSVD